MDVLSEVLKVVKLQGAMFYNGEFSSPWSLCSPASSTGCTLFGAGCGTRHHLPLADGRPRLRAARTWGTHSS